MTLNVPNELRKCSIGQQAHSLHRIVKVGQIVETHRYACGCHRRTMHFEQTLHTAALNELHGELLVAEQGGQVLKQGKTRNEIKGGQRH